jgi:outer membrane receptor protein involved in Fe transport
MRTFKRLLALAGLTLLVATSALAQGTTGALNGTVTHEGAPLPGTTVTIESPALQGTRVAVSNVNGDFNFPALPPGQYTVTFEMDGMATVTRSVRVGLARTERANAEMQLSSVSEAITVTASAPAVLETTEVQANYDAKLVENLPVARNMQQIVQLAPGVSNTGPSGSQTGEDGTINAIVISGAYAYDSLYLVNGAVTNENLRGQTDDLFIEDAIQETTIITGSISAEYGRFTGGVVSAITKSGGNEFSGSFRDSFSDPSWTAASDFGEAKAASTLNETYEATMGGRIVRDRLWFFGAGRYFEQSFQQFFQNSAEERPGTVQTDERYEAKLTGQINPKHSLVGSYLSFEIDQTPHCAFGCWDINTMDLNGRQLPREMVTANYNGILSTNLLIEAAYSTRDLVFADSGGNHVTTDYTNPRDIALGSWAYDISFNGAWGAPIFCGVCDDEVRENEYYGLKGTYYLATSALGTHNIVAGYENFSESRLANNYQSGSSLDIYVYSGIAPTRVGSAMDPNSLRPVISAGDLILWTPIETLSRGSDFATDSLFINDKWDLSANWSFNIGARYDKNDGKDSSGNPISKDSNVSPRLGVIYDIRGDGRFRANASYSRYVSRIQEGVGGTAGGGNASYYLYEYGGPTIGGPDSGLSSFDVLEQVWTWLLAEGWSPDGGAEQWLVGAGVPGFNQVFPGDLQSPSVDEFTLGFGMQIGQKGFMRLDYVDREWGDFYVFRTAPGDQITGVPGTLDVQRFGNCSDCVERTYKGMSVQGSYRFTDRFNLGGNYTWSETKGNSIGENRGSGPLAETVLSYVEYIDYERNNPIGLLPTDSTHKARLWASYDLPLGAFGTLNFSALERFDSGTPYSAARTVDVGSYVENPGYATPPSTALYYFSDRGEYRWDDVTATDIAINYEIPIAQVSLFAQAELINAFNEQAQVTGSTSVLSLAPFDPFTETPVEGVHWAKASSFGQPTGKASFQLPRTYRFSVGLRF